MTRRSLAEQLAAATGKTAQIAAYQEQARLSEEAQAAENLARLERRTGARRAFGHAKARGGLPDTLEIGSIILSKGLIRSEDKFGNERHTNARPYFVTGIYRDEKGTILALDLHTMTSQPSRYSCELAFNEADTKKFLGSTRATAIRAKTIHTIKNQSVGDKGNIFDHAGIVGKMDSRIMADLILRRVESLTYTPATEHFKHCKIDPSWIREGFIFDQIWPENICNQSLGAQPDTIWDESTAPYKRKAYVPKELTAEMLTDIQRYAIAHSIECLRARRKITWPEIGTFPNWPELQTRHNTPIYSDTHRTEPDAPSCGGL
ncbi:MAG: hypothetical protein ACK4VI_01065 [Alphaproteobacteria bacterium]